MSNDAHVDLAFKVHEPTEKSNSSDVILIHGLTANKEQWDEVAKIIADKSKRRVYALDMRNHGDSSWSEDFGWKIMVDDVVHFMNEHSICSATLVGHSMGGIVSMLLSIAQPEKVEALVIEDVVPNAIVKKEKRYVLAGVFEAVEEALESIPPDTDLKDAINSVIEHVKEAITGDLLGNPEQREKFGSTFGDFLVQKDGRLVSKINLEGLKRFLLDSQEHNEMQGLYNGPALLVYGTASHINVPDARDSILKLFPNTQFVAVEGATHLVHAEFPEKFSESVVDFLNN